MPLRHAGPWALLEAGLLVQWREIELRAKPPAMLEISPKGTVPVLVLADGTVIEESLELMHWALSQADPRDCLVQVIRIPGCGRTTTGSNITSIASSTATAIRGRIHPSTSGRDYQFSGAGVRASVKPAG